jgi:RNA polymerase sigma-70 factor (ECF subfamily)
MSSPSSLEATIAADAPMALAPVAHIASFDEIYETYFAFVWRTSLRLGVDRSMLDDVVQEVFLVVHRRLGEFDWTGEVRAWLFSIVRRVAGHARRSARRKPANLGVDAATDLDSFRAESISPLASAEQAEELRIVQLLLDELDDEKREAFILFQLEQMTISEIALAVDENPNTVASRIRAARVALERGFAELKQSRGGP